MNKIERIKELVELLNHYRNAYYNNQISEISDFEYDQLFDELSALEQETGFVMAVSPTQTVGYEVKSELVKVKHNHPMLSLDKTKDVNDVVKFIGGRVGIAMAKMDGLTCSLRYINGNLVSAETRGDGETGEDILHCVKTIKNVPLHINCKNEVVVDGEGESGLTDRSILNIAEIYDFAESVDVEDVKTILARQIAYNTAIAQEGLRGNYGSNIGSILLETYGDASVMIRAKAMAAAGSDARMNGCEMPVIINSGSGNQGMTTSLPVIEYAKELKVSEEKLLRALALANLVTIHQKTSIGRLSAFCGAVSAGAGAGAGIAYLRGADVEGVSHTVANAIATTGGIVCDGAKASCASKIASAVEAGILGYNMHLSGNDFEADDGLVGETPEHTIANIGRLGKQGMKQTNEEIIKIMVGE